MKFSEAAFLIDKAYARALLTKRDIFRRATGTRETLITTLVTTHGVAPSKHRAAVVDAGIEMAALFR